MVCYKLKYWVSVYPGLSEKLGRLRFVIPDEVLVLRIMCRQVESWFWKDWDIAQSGMKISS